MHEIIDLTLDITPDQSLPHSSTDTVGGFELAPNWLRLTDKLALLDNPRPSAGEFGQGND